MNTHFDYTAYQQLMTKLRTEVGNTADTDRIEFLTDAMDCVDTAIKAFTSYVKTVADSENHIKLAYCRYEGAELQDIVMRADMARRNCHEAAIANVKILNRVAAMIQVSAIFTGDVSDRYDVADFCQQVTDTLFENRTK